MLVAHLADIVVVMDQMAAGTWHKLHEGDRRRLKFREDSFTEHNLLQLDLLYPELNVYRFNQSEEKEEGADWEWWLGNDKEGWVCLRIQAKRIHGTVYRYLGHDGELPGEYQYDTLIRQCDPSRGEYPFHVFYNGWGPGTFATKASEAIERSPYWVPMSAYKHLDWGCAAVSSYEVAALHSVGGRSRSSVPRYLEASMPWSEFFVAGRAKHVGLHTVSILETVHACAYEATARAKTRNDADAFTQAMEEFLVTGSEMRRRSLPSYAQAVRSRDVADLASVTLDTSLVCVTETPEVNEQQRTNFEPVMR